MAASWIASRELFAVSAGVIAAWLVVRWRMPRKEEQPEPLPREVLDRAADGLSDAQVRGDTIRTNLDERPASVQVSYVPGASGGRIPAIRLRVLVNDPIPFCFTVRRRSSQLRFDLLVRNSKLDSPPFEYELRKVALESTDLASRFECASNLARLMQRLLASGLEATLQEYGDGHDLRLEELGYDGFRLSLMVQPANDPAQGLNLDRVLELAEPFAQALETFILVENLEEAVKAQR